MKRNTLLGTVTVLAFLLWGAACSSQPAAPPAPTAAPAAPTAAAKPAATTAPAAPTAAPAAKINYPEKPVNFIVPSPAGGSVDLEARQITEAVKPFFPQPIAVVNRPGGGSGSVGTAEIAQAKPDGYTMGLVLSAALTVEPYVNDLPYK